MQTTLSAAQQDDVRQALLGPESDALIDLVFRLNLGLPANEASVSAMSMAAGLGWLVPQVSVPQLSHLGCLVADPLREYRLWQDRQGRIHGETESALLAPERYAGKAVLEVGSGFGCNLLSLARRVQGEFVGVEPMAIYRQFTPILAEREGLSVPEVVDGSGEALPFEDQRFDVVLCYSAHQYMDVRKALQEMARVLRPGGQLQIIGGFLGGYVEGLGRQWKRMASPSFVRHGGRTLLNTLSYEWLGRRVLVPTSEFATAAPIYPTRAAMFRWIESAGLSVRHDLVQRVGEETCFVADKARAAGAS